MADEEINNQEEVQSEEGQVDQEELAKQWEEQISQEGETETQETSEPSSKEEQSSEEETPVDQEELAKQWEEALANQQQTSESVNQEDLAKQWEEALAEQQAQSEENKSLTSLNIPIDSEKLDLILDIPLEITVEVGSKSIPLEDILKMTPNTIVELERYINEPVDIKVNGKLIAKGELYTVENNFGVKITSIVTVQERMRLLMEEVE